jgi:hypothetical protein
MLSLLRSFFLLSNIKWLNLLLVSLVFCCAIESYSLRVSVAWVIFTCCVSFKKRINAKKKKKVMLVNGPPA